MKTRVPLSLKLYGIVGLLSVSLMVIGVLAYFSIEYIEGSFKKSTEEEGVQMEAGMQAQVELGNAVHSFKNYLLRKNTKYVDSFHQALSDLKKQVEVFEKISNDEKEKVLINEIKDHLIKYNQTMDKLITARETSDDIAAIDKQVKGADRQIEEALKKLDSFAMKSFEENVKKTKTLIIKLKTLIMGTTILALISGALLTTILIRKIMKAILCLKETTEMASNGSLTTDVSIVSNDEIGDLAFAFNTMLGSLRGIISKIFTGINLLSESTEELTSTLKMILRMVDEQTNKTGQISTSSAEMSQTVVDIARNASEMALSATNTLKVADDGSSIVTKTGNEVQEISRTVMSLYDVINSLGERSKQIGEIINVIKDIADQTNLLALNAAIEAARAGEQGRGFAVVADEVRKLAERTAKSTTEISSMISSIQDETGKAIKSVQDGTKRVEAGVELAEQAKMSLNKIVETVGNLQSMVQQIATSTEEMSTVSGTISEDIETVAAISNETSSSSQNILESVNKLRSLSSDLQNIAGQFNIGQHGKTLHGKLLN
ncbi:MAG: methyl-accepting chemotaxis protein [Nitrospirae bacterium YQR-1]